MIFQALVNSHNEDLVSETSPCTNGRSILSGIVENFSANVKIYISWNCYTISKFENNKKNSKKATISSPILLDTDASNQNQHLLHKPYWNWATLSQDYTHQKSFKSLGLSSPNRYEIDLSNEVLNIDFGQGGAKILVVKSGLWKKYLPTQLTPGTWARTRLIDRYLFWTPTLTPNIFAAPSSRSMFGTSFKRSISYLFGD